MLRSLAVWGVSRASTRRELAALLSGPALTPAIANNNNQPAPPPRAAAPQV
jgi:hypothetical protein